MNGAWPTTTRRPEAGGAVHRRVQARHPGRVRRADRSGGKGALLRREGLYSSHIVEWHRARDVGALRGSLPRTARSARAPEQASSNAPPAQRRLEDQLARTGRRSRPREKHRSSWRSCWPRARTPRRSSSRDRRVLRGPRAAARHQACACAAVGRARATHYRRRRPGRGPPAQTPARPAQQAHAKSRPAVLDVLRSERFVDCSPGPGLLHAFSTRAPTSRRSRPSTGCCAPTARSASAAARRPTRPSEARAGRPERRWWSGRGTSPSSKGPRRGVYYDLYVVIDIFSRYVVAWSVRPQPSRASWPRTLSPTPSPATASRRPAHLSTPTGGPR